MRKICYVSGTRADFGLMQSTLQAINASPLFDLSVVVTGMHLSENFGFTLSEIEAAGLNVAACIPVDVNTSTGASMAHNLAEILKGCTDAFAKFQPDIVLLLGDRGEMLAGALAAIHLNIPVAHIHGGERSGTVDEPVRHAISKLSHFHFTATESARERLIRMGEPAKHIFVTGAPGLDGLHELAIINRATLCREAKFDPAKKIALFAYHPVLQEMDRAGNEAHTLLKACLESNLQVMALMPNSDAGSESVRKVLSEYDAHPMVCIETHLPRTKFVSWMSVCDVMVGNSSSGIIEAATFGTPVLNIGIRQNLRERNNNVVDVIAASTELHNAIKCALHLGRLPSQNIYGDGRSGQRILELLAMQVISPSVLLKSNVY